MGEGERRVIVYVDGFNLYFGLRAAGFKRWYWLDLVALSRALLRPDQTLAHVHYFTARIRSQGGNTADVHRQSTYIDALATCPELTRHEGHFLVKPARCKSCGSTWDTFEEKMSDVNLAVQLLEDAVDDRFDAAIVLSGDSDLATPIARVLARYPHKRVLVASPPNRHSEALKRVASGTFSVGADKLRRCQFPDTVLRANGVPLVRPEAWR